MRDLTFAELATKADAYKVLHGSQPVYLSAGEMPWNLATSCEEGGSHRLDISTSVWFHGFDPATGLNLRWSFDIEPRSANGAGSYQIDADACRAVVRALTGEARVQFRKYLGDCAKKVRERAEKFTQEATRQSLDAALLADLAATP